jgi:Xaa-Pro aminopeptidase
MDSASDPRRTDAGLPEAEGQEFGARRMRLLDALGDRAALLLPAAPASWPGREGEPRYEPDRELYYTTGWRAPGAVALLDPSDGEAPFRLYVAERDAEEERWHGDRPGPEEARAFGADETAPLPGLEDALLAALARVDRLYFRFGTHPSLDRQVIEALASARRTRRRSGRGLASVSDPGLVLDPLRRVKSAAEIERIRRAAAITVEAFREAAAVMAPGVGEWEVEAALESGFRRRGADGPAFGTIVASGANAVVLHYTRNDRRMQPGFVLLDAGAQVDLYAADVSRTYAVGPPVAGAAAALHDVVGRAQAAALEACEPGSSESAMHDAARAVLVEGARALGLLDGNDAGDDPAERDLIPHRTSHWLGLSVHDPGDYGTDEGPVPLEAGMVLTVEPGLYVSPDHPSAPPELRGVGVRIEDDVVVTATGPDVLTGALSRGQAP